MPHSRFSGEEIAKRGKEIYERDLRAKVETEPNIGKMTIIDVETGDYEINQLGIGASQSLYAKHPDAALYGVCIGYNVAA